VAIFRCGRNRLAHRPAPGDHPPSFGSQAAGLGFSPAGLNRGRVSRSGAHVAGPIARSKTIRVHPCKSVAKVLRAIEWLSPMEKRHELASSQRSPAPQSASSQSPQSWLAKHWDLLALLLLLLASMPAVWLYPRSLVVVRDTGLIDDNWHLDEVFKLSRGIWVG